jgi:hypothetical protein
MKTARDSITFMAITSGAFAGCVASVAANFLPNKVTNPIKPSSHPGTMASSTWMKRTARKQTL